jgi:hypothetical protein
MSEVQTLAPYRAELSPSVVSCCGFSFLSIVLTNKLDVGYDDRNKEILVVKASKSASGKPSAGQRPI